MSAGPQKIAARGEKVRGFTLYLLGEFSLAGPQGQTVSINGKRPGPACHSVPVAQQTMTRERLAGLLWVTEGGTARNSLRQSLAVFPKGLGRRNYRIQPG